MFHHGNFLLHTACFVAHVLKTLLQSGDHTLATGTGVPKLFCAMPRLLPLETNLNQPNILFSHRVSLTRQKGLIIPKCSFLIQTVFPLPAFKQTDIIQTTHKTRDKGHIVESNARRLGQTHIFLNNTFSKFLMFIVNPLGPSLRPPCVLGPYVRTPCRWHPWDPLVFRPSGRSPCS